MAAAGYPASYAKGTPISGLAAAAAIDGVTVYHAGTKLTEGQYQRASFSLCIGSLMGLCGAVLCAHIVHESYA